MHLAHDVAAADELSVDVELRYRRPVRIFLDALPNRCVCQHVDRKELVDAARLQHPHRGVRKAALRKLRRTLHVKHDRMPGHLLTYRILDAHRPLRGFPCCHFTACRVPGQISGSGYYSLTAPVSPDT